MKKTLNTALNLSLFDASPEAKPVTTGDRCKHCIHLYEHQYGSMKYCKQQRDPRTSYGNKKIKANDPACPLFEKKEKNPITHQPPVAPDNQPPF